MGAGAAPAVPLAPISATNAAHAKLVLIMPAPGPRRHDGAQDADPQLPGDEGDATTITSQVMDRLRAAAKVAA